MARNVADTLCGVGVENADVLARDELSLKILPPHAYILSV